MDEVVPVRVLTLVILDEGSGVTDDQQKAITTNPGLLALEFPPLPSSQEDDEDEEE